MDLLFNERKKQKILNNQEKQFYKFDNKFLKPNITDFGHTFTLKHTG